MHLHMIWKVGYSDIRFFTYHKNSLDDFLVLLWVGDIAAMLCVIIALQLLSLWCTL